MAIKQVIQIRHARGEDDLHLAEWRDLKDGPAFFSGEYCYEFRVREVFPIGYTCKARWSDTIYEVIGEPVTSRFGGVEVIAYPIRATERNGDTWHTFEDGETIGKREGVKQ